MNARGTVVSIHIAPTGAAPMKSLTEVQIPLTHLVEQEFRIGTEPENDRF